MLCSKDVVAIMAMKTAHSSLTFRLKTATVTNSPRNMTMYKNQEKTRHRPKQKLLHFIGIPVLFFIQLILFSAALVVLGTHKEGRAGAGIRGESHAVDETTFAEVSLIRSKKNGKQEEIINHTLFQPTKKSREEQALMKPSEYQSNSARAFVLERKNVYATMNAPFSMRGVGWLYEHHGVVLTAILRTTSVDIFNVGRKFPCEKLTIWVRVAGPEVHAGKAKSIEHNDSSCHWSFAINLQSPGIYKVDTKVLLYNPSATVTSCTRIDESMKTLPIHQFPIHRSVTGFKFYTPLLSCCEVCTRDKECRHWSTVPMSGAIHGCELFYSDGRERKEVSSFQDMKIGHERLSSNNDILIAHGPPRDEPTAYYLGCGWSFYLSIDFPCLSNELDDQVHMTNNSLIVSQKTLLLESKDHTMPLCTAREEIQSRGRWVRRNVDECPLIFDEKFNEQFNITKYNSTSPICWHRDDLSIVGQTCVEAGCAKWLPTAWISSLKLEPWYGRWEPYSCTYLDLTDQQLQQCFNKKQISSISMEGHSIARFVNQYLQQRLDGLEFANKSEISKQVVVTTLSFPHLLWRESEEGWYQELTQREMATPNKLFFWISGFFYSSEREPFVHQGRAEKLTELAQKVLGNKGYTMIQAMDMTAAFTYDTATQMDGLHIIGPPMKMIITKLFHHLCHDYAA